MLSFGRTRFPSDSKDSKVGRVCVCGLTVGTVVVVHLLEAGGAGAGVSLVAGETQVAAASVVGSTAVPATCSRDRDAWVSTQ